MPLLILILLFIFPISAIIFHVWTVVIAFTIGGFWWGVVTLIFPMFSEIYWMIKMWGVNNLYTALCVVHVIGAILWKNAKNKQQQKKSQEWTMPL